MSAVAIRVVSAPAEMADFLAHPLNVAPQSVFIASGLTYVLMMATLGSALLPGRLAAPFGILSG